MIIIPDGVTSVTITDPEVEALIMTIIRLANKPAKVVGEKYKRTKKIYKFSWSKESEAELVKKYLMGWKFKKIAEIIGCNSRAANIRMWQIKSGKSKFINKDEYEKLYTQTVGVTTGNN